MLRMQRNAWIHLAATIAVCAIGWLARLSAADWQWVTTAVVFVRVAETMNTAFEYGSATSSRRNFMSPSKRRKTSLPARC
jgi:diacylglycerol kinase